MLQTLLPIQITNFKLNFSKIDELSLLKIGTGQALSVTQLVMKETYSLIPIYKIHEKG
jgi:hypothetical protein